MTWYENYERMGKFRIPLLENRSWRWTPDECLILVEGMTRGFSGRGDFTGLALEDFFNDRVNDPINARRVVNGRDQACRIAGYYEKFLAAIKAATLCLVLVLGMGLAGCKSPAIPTTTTHEVHRDSTHHVTRAAAAVQEEARGWQHERVVTYDTVPVRQRTGFLPRAARAGGAERIVRGEGGGGAPFRLGDGYEKRPSCSRSPTANK